MAPFQVDLEVGSREKQWGLYEMHAFLKTRLAVEERVEGKCDKHIFNFSPKISLIYFHMLLLQLNNASGSVFVTSQAYNLGYVNKFS